MDWNAIWQTIKDFFGNNGWAILGFFVALILGFIVVKILVRICRNLLAKTKMEKIAQKFIINIIKVGLYLLYIIMLLSILGVQITGIIAALSAAVLAVGLALQNSLSNLANGIIIISGKVFKEGDYILVDGVEGTVSNINLLSTTILTADNKKITLPNSTIVNNPMTNFSSEKTRRVDIIFDLAYDVDIEKAKKVLLDVAMSDGRVLLEPMPVCRLKFLQASSIQLSLNVWVDSEDYWDVYYYLIDKCFNELKRNKIDIPFNQLEVRMREDNVKMPFDKTPLPKRVEKERKEEKKHSIFDIEITGGKNKRKKAKKAEKTLQKIEKSQQKEVKKSAKKKSKEKTDEI